MTATEIATICDGVFFTRPRSLPRGKHDLARDEVGRIQRDRIVIAIVELLADGGHRAIGAREVCLRAGVSLTAFYDNFADRDEAVSAAYQGFIDVLLGRLISVSSEGRTWREYVEAVLAAYFGTLSDDLVVAKAFQVEMDAMGKAARARRREALVGMAQLLRDKHREWDASAGDRVPETAYLVGVYAARQLASDALDSEHGTDDAIRSDLEQIRVGAVDWVLRLVGDVV
ncbi:TetR/AcrR family transcriptional regulator [Aeromicrobium fastidiosum]|uniref:TetR/AcrR family transcriptional regulator n=1 Tax=Aeromicrobium fastidiosum TaxID=52699 RepID=A0A641AQD5_9ACTN|nr:TetR/AcrR family transcriptional regulator [Aeromicrobium fastidiosum]KAA1378465.1 TetR/AcrR family transcriptional regulator [Aeromicrobium fastidiosum]MBP2392570.1 AcrR family transcriptional regulator [Aeromicrobium fastidiosum]